MKVQAHIPSQSQKMTHFFSETLRLLLRLLLAVVLLGFLGGIIKTFLDLGLLFHASVETAFRQILIDVLILLAVVEVVKTVLSYLSDGRVIVTYIIDTVLIVMFNELLTLWFKNGDNSRIIIMLVILLALIFMRILAIKFSPGRHTREVRDKR
jgi:uncharacterized membrane protein (DUF373 family)